MGARRSFELAARALAAGHLDQASVALRAYFAARFAARTPLSPGDAHLAILAASCAFLRGDTEELAGVALVVQRSSRVHVRWAQYWVGQLQAAEDGDLALVLERCTRVPPGVEEVVPAVLVVAVERSLATLTPALLEKTRSALGHAGAKPPIVARFARSAAQVFLREGDLSRALAELLAITEDAPAALRLLRAVALGDPKAARGLLPAVSDDERAGAIGLAVELVSNQDARTMLDAFAEALPPPAKARLLAGAALHLLERGDLAGAVAGVVGARALWADDIELTRAAALVGLGATDVTMLREVASLLPPGDDTRHAAALAITALEGGELEGALLARALPPDLARAVAPIVLCALARSTRARRLPPWLAEPPDDVDALRAWALLRVNDGESEEALAALEERAATGGELLADTTDVARLSLASQELSRGDPARAARLCDQVSTHRLLAHAAELRALAAAKGLATGLPEKGTEAEILALIVAQATQDPLAVNVIHEVAHRRVRALLAAERNAEARAALAELPSHDAEHAFLQACAALGDRAGALDGARTLVSDARRRAPEHVGLAVLDVELNARTVGPAAHLVALEALSATHGPRPAIALALARARRRAGDVEGARRLLFEQYEGRTPPRPHALEEELRAVLAAESRSAIPLAGARRDRARQRFFAADTIADRAPVLVARLEAAPTNDSDRVSTLKEALLGAVRGGDLVSARAAEVELLALLVAP